jgi:hypothetical protein
MIRTIFVQLTIVNNFVKQIIHNIKYPMSRSSKSIYLYPEQPSPPRSEIPAESSQMICDLPVTDAEAYNYIGESPSSVYLATISQYNAGLIFHIKPYIRASSKRYIYKPDNTLIIKSIPGVIPFPKPHILYDADIDLIKVQPYEDGPYKHAHIFRDYELDLVSIGRIVEKRRECLQLDPSYVLDYLNQYIDELYVDPSDDYGTRKWKTLILYITGLSLGRRSSPTILNTKPFEEIIEPIRSDLIKMFR